MKTRMALDLATTLLQDAVKTKSEDLATFASYLINILRERLAQIEMAEKMDAFYPEKIVAHVNSPEETKISFERMRSLRRFH